MGFSPTRLALPLSLLLSLAVLLGIPCGRDAARSTHMECLEPGSCDAVDDARFSLRDLLDSIVSGRSIEKRGKKDTRVSGFSPSEKEAIVRIHNQLRQSVDPPASNMLEMSWSDELERVANNYAKQCTFAHNQDRTTQAKSFTSVGENIHAGSSSYDEVGAVQSWFNEDKYYNYDRHSCSNVCGHYTQVVWAKSYKVGCGVKFCSPLKGVSWGQGYITVCNYGPAGNYRGVRPYEKGTGKTKLLKPPTSNPSSSGSGSGSTTSRPKETRKKNQKNKSKKPRKSRKNRKMKKPKKSRSRKTKKASRKASSVKASRKASSVKTSQDAAKSSAKRTCQIGRQQALDLKNDLQQELKNAQPSSMAWRTSVRRTCSRGRTNLDQLRSQLAGNVISIRSRRR